MSQQSMNIPSQANVIQRVDNDRIARLNMICRHYDLGNGFDSVYSTDHNKAFLKEILGWYEEVQIDIARDSWYGYILPWYNKLSEVMGLKVFSRPLSRLNGLTVLIPFRRVQLEGKSISVQDILLSARALAVNANRSTKSYKIVKIEGKKVWLEVEIDNYTN